MLLQQIVNGLMLGSVYTLIALAYTLVMGILNVLNIAVAEVFMIGSFTGLALLRLGLPLPISLLGAMIVGGVASLLIERFAYRPLRNSPVVMPLLSTVGFTLILQNVATNIWGSDPNRFPNHLFVEKNQFGPILVSNTQLWIVAAAIVLVLALSWVVQRSRLGRHLRAVAENPAAAAVLGANITGVQRMTFLLSGLLAGAAGLLVGLNYSAITPHVGVEVGLKGIAVMVVGGVNSIWGSLLAGPLLGIAQVLTAGYLGSSYQDIVVYGLLIATLMFRPQGLLGRAEQVGRRI